MKELAHNLLHAILPGVPCYVAFASDNPPAPLKMTGALGTTGRTADLLAMQWLKDRGEWVGRQPLIWINDVEIVRLAAEHHAEHGLTEIELQQQATTGIVVHEAGHVAEKPVDRLEPTEARMDFAVAIAAYSDVVESSDEFPPFYGHDWKFIRNCCHLFHRAKLAGFTCPPHFVFAGETYEIAEFEHFMYPIDGVGELRNLERESIFDINTFRPPFYFTRLWQASVRNWLARQTNHSGAISLAIQMLTVELNKVEELECQHQF